MPVYNFCYDEDNILTRFIFKIVVKIMNFIIVIKVQKVVKEKENMIIKQKNLKYM